MISVIICTYNRGESLGNTLESIASMELSTAFSWELIVIDNNSTDNTSRIVAQFSDAVPFAVRYFLEKKQGLSHARNRGIHESAGEILAFADDDVLVDKGWINSIFTTFQNRDVSCAGGKIYPHWQKPCPKWLKKELHGHLALLDLGDEELKMTKPTLWGANLIFRASMFEKYGMFDTSLGRTAGKLYGNEEVVLLKKLIENEEGVYYVPGIVVHHCIGPNRMKKSYFRKWFFDAGELDGIQMGHYRHRNVYGVPYYVLKDAFNVFGRCVAGKIRRQENEFLSELSLLRTAGFLCGRMKAHRSQDLQPEMVLE